LPLPAPTFLGKHASATDAFAIVSRYYPSGRLPPKTQFGIEEIFGGASKT
jgi:hypothetical protein